MSKITLIHPISNPYARNAAFAIAEAALLNSIVTTFAYQPESIAKSWWGKAIKTVAPKLIVKLEKELGRRSWVVPKDSKIYGNSWREILRTFLVKTRLGKRFGIDDQFLIDWVVASCDRDFANHYFHNHHLQNIKAVYAYEDVAADTFLAAKKRSIYCFYDLQIAFHLTSRRIQNEEAELFPELAATMLAVQEPEWKIERKNREVELADHIFVASSFTERSLLDIGVPRSKITVIPYGAPIEYFQPHPKQDKLFRVMFAGQVGTRKGVHYLLQAWQELSLSESELLLVGVNQMPIDWLSKYDRVRLTGSVPHSCLNVYYSSANVFVFPSLVEGFGLVLLEAMACGIPIITTPNTGGPDIIIDGIEGFIIPIRDVEALKAKIAWCYSHPQELAKMGIAARKKAEQWTWERYRQKLAMIIKEKLE
ncbi:glycosyltransferase family 4 protein [Pseudanabaena sp. UWO311]|uniref:glycosyltransferase family 4 protein n=1 Tax=Pseudanabaena sp. UWO311 TaxID=2487337 RepID=UPI0011597265|nr:glycosyltransferase family 4 protein [Pseudanabaena sp. UWO311]TYQ23364.1 glycosyltransferase family 4 protein [Pseudanabaena sp. UWO311]